MNEKLKEIYELLLERFGHQKWWPGDSTFEIIIGAILTQNTNWQNVEKAIDNLRRENLLDPEKLHNIPAEKLAEHIRPAGYYKVKTKRLKNFLNYLHNEYAGDLAALQGASTPALRQELLDINGIGPETADSILLYALDRPAFVVDTYTARIMIRHQLIDEETDYHQLQELFTSNLEPDIDLFNEFHALLVACGKYYCRPKPQCSQCPLNLLPHTI